MPVPVSGPGVECHSLTTRIGPGCAPPPLSRCCSARIRLRDNLISLAFGLSNDERMSWKMLWRFVLFLSYHTNLMPAGQSLLGFRSEHLIAALSAPHQYANTARWLAARTRRHGCCSSRGERYIGRGCARPRFHRSQHGRAKPRTAFVLFSATLIRVSNHDCPSPVAQRMLDGTGGFIIGLYGRR